MTGILKIGMTGGIGSGKTTVTRLFEKLGVPVIDADRISHELVRKGSKAYQAIIEKFGNHIIDGNGELDRALLRQLVFTDPAKKHCLEKILHPLVREEMMRQTESAQFPYCILSIPLLFESGREASVDRILVIDTSEEQQIERASLRDQVNRDTILNIMKAQVSREQRLAAADDVIHNEGEIGSLEQVVSQLHDKYLAIAANSLE